MTLARIHTRALVGIDAPPVEVEVHIANGLPAFTIVGLPEAAVRESRDRVRAAILNSGFEFPNRRLTVNLAPADLPKDSGRFDLPIAIGILVATDQLDARPIGRRLFVGELSLSGELRPIRGALAMGLALARLAARCPQAGPADPGIELIVPQGNADELSVLPELWVSTATSLAQVCDALAGRSALPRLVARAEPPDSRTAGGQSMPGVDMADVRGQQAIKTGLEVAAAGAHHVLLIGPPGSGKSMLARRLHGIVPPLRASEALEAGAIWSLAGRFDVTRWRERAFRAPHHSASMAALIGGGARLRPGEISLAHHGILFLDELPEFGSRSLDSLREPIETGQIALSRAARQVELPARFQLITAMNPCPCGLYGDPRCRCTPDQVARYQHRVSGPLLDRLDLQLWVAPVDGHTLMREPDSAGRAAASGAADETAAARTAAPEGASPGSQHPVETSAMIAARVVRARERQLARQGCVNGELDARQVPIHCALDARGRQLLVQTASRLHWSARVFHRIQKIARSIADLQECDDIAAHHVAQAISYRRVFGLIGQTR